MTTAASAHLGLDIAKAKFDAALLQDGKTQHRQFANNQTGFSKLFAWLNGRATLPLHACMEATGCYGQALALALHQQSLRVSVVNPAQIKAFAKSELLRTKTDKVDAALIARFCAAQQPRLWAPLPLERRQLQALVRRLHALQAMRRQELNRKELEPANSLVHESLSQHLKHLDQQIATLHKQIQTHVQTYPSLREQAALLQSIPAIGQLTAVRLLAEIPLLGQYRSARQAAAYAGLSPCHRQSGSSVHGKSHLSKVGNAAVRQALYLPAVVAMRANPLLRSFAQKLLEAGKPKMCVVGAVMRKLLHQAHGVLKHNRPFDPNYPPTT